MSPLKSLAPEALTVLIFTAIMLADSLGCGSAGGGDQSVAAVGDVAAAVANTPTPTPAPPPAPTPAPKKTVDFMGDSITAAWLLDDYFKDTININKGVPGEDPQAMEKRFKADVLDLNPAVVVILGGTNCPHPTTIAAGDAACVSSIIAMAQAAQAASIKVIVGLIPPRKFAIEPYDESLKAALMAAAITTVDFYTPMVLPDFNENPALFKDGTHPNDAGYAVMAAALEPALQAALK